MDSKLKCVFEMPVDGETSNPTAASETITATDETRRIGDSVCIVSCFIHLFLLYLLIY